MPGHKKMTKSLTNISISDCLIRLLSCWIIYIYIHLFYRCFFVFVFLNFAQDRGDTLSQMSQDSSDSREREPIFIQASDIRRRLTDSLNAPTKSFQRDPEDPSAAALKVMPILQNSLWQLKLIWNVCRNRGKRKWHEFENRLLTAITAIGNCCRPSSSVAMICGKNCWLIKFYSSCIASGKRSEFHFGSDLIGTILSVHLIILLK